MMVDLINGIVLIIIRRWSSCVCEKFLHGVFKHELLKISHLRRKITLLLLRPLKSQSSEIKEIRPGYFHFHAIPIFRESFVSEKLIKPLIFCDDNDGDTERMNAVRKCGTSDWFE